MHAGLASVSAEAFRCFPNSRENEAELPELSVQYLASSYEAFSADLALLQHGRPRFPFF